MTPDGKKRQVDLQVAVTDWPTPCARDKETAAKLTRGANASDGGTPLILAVEQSASMCCAEDFPAKMSPTTACAPVWTEPVAACGGNLPDALANFDPVSSSWKTCAGSLFEEVGTSLPNLPVSGMWANGKLYALPTWGLRTDAPACSSSASDETWPTPDASVMNEGEGLATWEARRQREKAKHRNGNGFGTPLAIKVQQTDVWPTPQSYSKGKPDNSAPGLTPLDIAARPDLDHLKDWPSPIKEDSESRTAHGTLLDAVRDWPTPQTTDAAAAARHTTTTGVMHPGTTLTDAVREDWRTPSTRDWKGPSAQSWRDRPDGDLTPTLCDQMLSSDGPQDPANRNTSGNPPAPSPRPVLNPRWVLTLMGFPADYLDGVVPPSRRSGTPSSRRLRKSSPSE